jgi:hypothetical protein
MGNQKVGFVSGARGEESGERYADGARRGNLSRHRIPGARADRTGRLHQLLRRGPSSRTAHARTKNATRPRLGICYDGGLDGSGDTPARPGAPRPLASLRGVARISVSGGPT